MKFLFMFTDEKGLYDILLYMSYTASLESWASP